VDCDCPDLTCVSYLASVKTLFIERYPPADYGAEVTRIERSVAADGPIVAATANALGLNARLLSNSVAEDEAGAGVREILHNWGVNVPSQNRVRSVTPTSTVICDATGTRTWFPHLIDVVSELKSLNLESLTTSRMAYIDCYAVLCRPAKRAVKVALDASVPVIANLGGSRLPGWLVKAATRQKVLMLQTSVPEAESANMVKIASELVSFDVAKIVVVTGGRYGAVAVEAGGTPFHQVAHQVEVRQVQGAGAVFSAAFASALLHQRCLRQAVLFACAAASIWCAQRPGDPPPSIESVWAAIE
jgi:sugar/nucleoside kinase (ribokinase family)